MLRAARISVLAAALAALAASACGGDGSGPTPNAPYGSNSDAGATAEGGASAIEGSTPLTASDSGNGGSTGNGGHGSADAGDSTAIATGLDAQTPSGPSDGALPITGPDSAGDGSGKVLDASVLAIMKKVADWQLMQGGIGAIDWIHGAMWTGIFATYQVTQDTKYRDAAKAWGQSNAFGLSGGVTTNADNQCAAQTYFDLYLSDPIASNMAMYTGAKPSFDAMVASGNTGWTWADSLFMSPPALVRLGTITNDPKYVQLLHTNWWKAYAAMFSTADGLMYRDPPGGGPAAGSGIYWARGNGWVIAGTARVLEQLPMIDPRRPEYVKMLTTMAAALKPWQGMDGLWRSDITHPARFPNPETSGTGFMTFAMAWGINNGVLDRAAYLPIVKAAWQGLIGNVDAAGKLGYVQGVGAAPAAARASEQRAVRRRCISSRGERSREVVTLRPPRDILQRRRAVAPRVTSSTECRRCKTRGSNWCTR